MCMCMRACVYVCKYVSFGVVCEVCVCNFVNITLVHECLNYMSVL